MQWTAPEVLSGRREYWSKFLVLVFQTVEDVGGQVLRGLLYFRANRAVSDILY